MPQVWFTADTHFGHANIIRYGKRPFLSDDERQLLEDSSRGDWKVSKETLERHDAALLAAINDRVQQDDTLWVLGDFCLGKFREARRYLDQIVCNRVNLVWGNHDHPTVGEAFNKTIEQGMISVRGQAIWLNHYPMRSWDRRFHGSWHLYGHVHGRLVHEDQQELAYLTRDMGVDACEYRPVSFDELAIYMEPRIKVFESEKAAFVAGDQTRPID